MPVLSRPTCLRCLKPRSTCVCASIRRVDNRTGVFVLQHPREHAHPIGTARFVELGLAKSQVVVARAIARDVRVPLALPPRTGLLYPRHDARDLEELPESERPEHLVVLDGTWSQARTLYRQNTWLHALPHLRLSPSAPSRYRIRKEPSPECVSTLESVLLALSIIEPETEGFSALLAAFDAMIDMQIRHIQSAKSAGVGRRRRRSLETRRFRGVPRWLGDGFERLVGVYAEALSLDERARTQHRDLLQLVAVRFSDGECLERMVEPESGLPGEEALASMGLTRADFAGAITPEELGVDLADFLEKSSVCVSWNGSTPSLMHNATGLTHRVRLLRPVVRGLANIGLGPPATIGPSPSLDQLVDLTSGAIPVTPLPLRGRAAVRLANLRFMAEWTRERGRCVDRSAEPVHELETAPTRNL